MHNLYIHIKNKKNLHPQAGWAGCPAHLPLSLATGGPAQLPRGPTCEAAAGKPCLRPQGRQPPPPPPESTTREAAPTLPRPPRSTPLPPCAPPRLRTPGRTGRRRRRAAAAALSASRISPPRAQPHLPHAQQRNWTSVSLPRPAAEEKGGGGGERWRREILAACRRHFE